MHDVHVWQLTRGAPVFSAHVVVDAAALREGRTGAILGKLQGCLAEHFDVEHSTFQLEPAGHVEHDAHAYVSAGRPRRRCHTCGESSGRRTGRFCDIRLGRRHSSGDSSEPPTSR